jgi:hypothetical protein
MTKWAFVICMLALVWAVSSRAGEESAATSPRDAVPIPDPEQVGGEDASIVQVANLIYARVKSSKCFSDHFLVKADEDSAISTSRRFHAVKLESAAVFQYPFVIMTGEGSFDLTETERENLKKYCESGGFLLASAGCSSEEWDKSFRAELKKIWPEAELEPLSMGHPVFHTVYDVKKITAKQGEPRPLEGINCNGRLVLLYSQDGLNNTANTHGCCCCGGNEIANSEQINVNILAYALTF